ncbi:short-chain dehydrogenase [Fistulina hepatica ATCC 64428]|uniref:Short-chain dehydrogenase n=1 Tax=Fistulina hepatica ATCC 64428 TaxID=1128425 RepID=A0A0D7A4G4_9AGAR|nr:short-chain dehydrogenase [Fistulina hepatica ATCC 64428]
MPAPAPVSGIASKFVFSNIYDLTGRVAFITGGGSGIGRHMAHGLAANGAKVYIADFNKANLDRTLAEWDGPKGSLNGVTIDVTNRESIQAARDYIAEKEGRLHILVNNAGQEGPKSLFFNDMDAPEHKDAETLGHALFENETLEGWSRLYTVNSASVYFVTMCFLGLLAKGSEDTPGYTSCVINTTSISAITSCAQNHFCYNSSKAAASALTRLLACELALKNVPIRVNAIAPGMYETAMTKDVIPLEMLDKMAGGTSPIPAKRPGKAEEMAGAIVFLASRAGCYTNGQELKIDGGYCVVNP